MRDLVQHAFMVVKSGRATFSAFLRGVMDANDIDTAAELARMLDIEPATVGRWLNEVGEPSLDNLRRMAPNLRIRLGDLMIVAGVATEAELGHKAAAARPLPPEIKRIMELLDDPNISDRYKKILRQGVDAARKFFLEMFRAPSERVPSARR